MYHLTTLEDNSSFSSSISVIASFKKPIVPVVRRLYAFTGSLQEHGSGAPG
jgi:hypothetical protein